MAKKKKKITRRKGGRRRMGAVKFASQADLKLIAGGIVGAAASGVIRGFLPDTLDDKVKSAIMVAAGLLFVKNREDLVKGAAIGVSVVNGYGLVNQFLPESTKLPALGAPKLLGFNDYPNNPQRVVIGGFNDHPNSPQRNVIAGVNAYVAGGCGL